MKELNLTPEQIQKFNRMAAAGGASFADMVAAIRKVNLAMSVVKAIAVRRVREEMPTQDAMHWSPEDVRPDTPAVR
jgi:phosphoribosylformylglycinamidine (FGAM) synthase-like amidotransferase family enzyme